MSLGLEGRLAQLSVLLLVGCAAPVREPARFTVWAWSSKQDLRFLPAEVEVAALAFAPQRPMHALSSELLAHSVALSHTVSGEGDTRAAFQHLHKVYGNTTWARNTPISW